MIPPSHARWAQRLFFLYLRNLCRRRFASIQLLGGVPPLPDETSLLMLPNHSTWWDGFFPYLLNERVLKREFYIMMLENKLKEFWFFRKLGAYSINQQSPKAIAETLQFTASLLDGEPIEMGQHHAKLLPNKPLVVMFPQGELRPWSVRPLGYNRGVEWLLKKCSKPLVVLPLAMRCEFTDAEKPTAFLLFGQPYVVSQTGRAGQVSRTTEHALPTAQELESAQEQLLDDIVRRITSGEQGVNLLA